MKITCHEGEGSVKVKLQMFYISVLDRCEWSATHFTPEETAAVTPWALDSVWT
jgi:hypothetical protein